MGIRRKSLRRYEGTNLLFFLVFIVALGVFVLFVFQAYKNPNARSSKRSTKENGIVSEVVAPESDICVYYLTVKLSQANRQYRSRLDIPATDDGLVRDLFAIPGVEEVAVNQRMLMLRKFPSARWESIQSVAREVINSHLHMHQ